MKNAVAEHMGETRAIVEYEARLAAAAMTRHMDTIRAQARMMTAEVRRAFSDVGYNRSYGPAAGWLPSMDSGGIVPGPIGKPQLILAHGGETVLPTHKTSMPSLDLSGGGSDFDVRPGQMVLAVIDNRIWRQMERNLKAVRLAEAVRGVG